MKLQEIIMPGETNLWHLLILQEADDGWRHAREMQTEEITSVTTTHLQQRYLIMMTLGEARSRLRINTQNILLQEEIYCGICIFSLVYHNHLTWEESPWQTVDCFLVETSENNLHFTFYSLQVAKLKKKAEKKDCFSHFFTNFAEKYLNVR